ncbi:MAG: DUF3078 domain-containing protein [Bacteroidales bacterium]|nr:DUF3078 domain-containing protein [Bacteroidales bacterium]
MRRICLLLFWIGLLYFSSVNAQNNEEVVFIEKDTISSEPIVFEPASASEYINNLLKLNNLWRSDKDTLRQSLSRLIEHFNEPFDSVRIRLSSFPYDATEFTLTEISLNDTLPVRWLEEDVFIIDTMLLEKDPVVQRQIITMRTIDIDALVLTLPENTSDLKAMIDSIFWSTTRVMDTITEVYVDYKYLESKNVPVHSIESGTIVPPLLPPGSGKTARFLADSTNIVITETWQVIMANDESPFYIVPDGKMPDSLKSAVETLLTHTFERDSIQMFINDVRGQRKPFWLGSAKDDLYRFWVRNAENDSITIWLGNPAKYDLTMILEDDIRVERMQKKTADDIPIVAITPDRTLAKLSPFKETPVHWSYSLVNAFSLNQNYLANWSKGGQSSLSGMIDVKGEAKYANKASGATWTNIGRIRYGSIRTKEQGVRTSTDIVELNSQYNRVMANKLDFSSIFYAKTQLAKGYNYPNDSVVISKFLNPGTFTIGVGVEYKPFKETLMNFSVLSYKNTFVLDTTNISQTTHGVEIGKRAKQEMGGQLMIRNKALIMDGLSITNAIRLFSNYIDKPQNVDVDWEMNIDKQINWLFTIRLNLHLIYDDDIRFPVLDANDEPVLLPDGSPRKVAKTQFNQFLGLTLSLRM